MLGKSKSSATNKALDNEAGMPAGGGKCRYSTIKMQCKCVFVCVYDILLGLPQRMYKL